ncbi:MAG: ribonucleotide reductase [Acaryochloridaceae cyanobacterium SU_2_1]|nr:ribonucleotide reductase [Acaryochloridaceae cyanobacterium SU_2_1]
MARESNLLDLMTDFAGAFAMPSQLAPQPELQKQSDTSGSDPMLLSFVEPELEISLETSGALTLDPSASDLQTSGEEVFASRDSEPGYLSTSVTSFAVAPPVGAYAQALTRQVSTLTWGKVEFHLTYGEQGLQSLWVTVGKSGTEAQSLCEAIARLINLLLSQQVSISDIARQIRGIRGADAEGLGPNRILGLADLIGKVLQEAPSQLNNVQPSTSPEIASLESPQSRSRNTPEQEQEARHNIPITDVWSTIWADLDEQNHSSQLCPECGAELHQVNGCSGGACVVCGYSSCS